MLKRIDWRNIGRNWLGKAPSRRRRKKSGETTSVVARTTPESLEKRALLTLTLNFMSTSIVENAGAAATTATVARDGDLTNPLTVTLSSNDLGEATVPATVVIAAGESISPAFNIGAVDDLLVDGTQSVVITATEASHGNDAVFLDVTDDDVATLTVSIAANISEAAGGAATTGTVSRNTPVTTALAVTLASNDASEAGVPATVNIPAGQTSVTFDIAAIDDSLLDGTQTATITASATGFVAGADTVDVTDSENLTVVIAAASIVENAGAAATTATVTRSNTDNGSALTVTLASNDASEAGVPATVTIPAGNASVTFDIAAIDDTILDGTQNTTITASAAGYVAGTDTVDVTDSENLTVVIAAASIAEDAGAAATTATVTRSNTDTTAALTVNLASNEATEATVPAAVTIPAGQAAVTFNIDAVDDAILDGTQTATITASAAGYVAGTDTVDVTDSETLTVVIAAASIAENAGAAATTATVTRNNTDTTSALTVNLASNDATEASVPATVVIPAGDASVTFNIDAVDDTILDGTQTATITASAAGYVAGTDTVDVTDSQTLTVVIAAASIAEDAGAAATTATVTRNNTNTTAALTVNLASNDATEATAPSTVTIPAGQTAVTFNIDAVDDTILDGTQTATITASAAGYGAGTDTVDVTDSENLTVVIAAASIAENAGAAATTATVTRSNTDTTAALTVNLASNDATEATAPSTVTIPAGQAAVTFNIDAVDDAILDGTQTATITASAAGYVAGTDTVDVTDSETLTIVIAAASIAENAGAAATTATVTRNNTDNGSALTVTLASDDTSEASVPATVVIPAGDASVTFDIAAIDDTILDGTQTATITVSATGYIAGTDTVDVTDSENLTIVIAVASIAENAGAAATTATVTRNNTDTTSALTVNLASNDATEATVPAAVTIPAGQASVTFNIDAVDDSILDGTQTATITASATGYIAGTDTVNVTDSENLTVVIAAASIAEDASAVATTATVTRNNTDTTSALIVNLASNDATEATVPSTVTIPAGQASVTFNIDAVDDAILDGTQTATITASAAGYVAGTDTVDVTDSETLTIVIAAASIAENAGAAATTATITRNNTDNGSALTVTLASDDASEANVPATVTIPAGQAAVTFNIDAIDDTILDGTQTATITASATGYVAGTDTVDVTDSENLTIVIAAASIAENAGAAATTATVTRSNTDTTAALTVNLASNDASEADVPATVTIPAGQAAVTFNIDAVDDSLLDGTQAVVVMATASGYGNATQNLNVDDYEALTVAIDDDAISENGGLTTATVTRSNTDTSFAVTITLATSDASEATVPATVVIPAGQPSVTFDVTAVDDTELDGTQSVVITATAAGYTAIGGSVDVTDQEELVLTILGSSISEAAGATTATVSRHSADIANPLVVTLTSSDISEATVTSSITIPAGQTTSSPFAVGAVNDMIADGDQTATITAAGSGYTDGTDTITVEDDDGPTALTVSVSPTSISEDGGTATGTVTRNSETTSALTVTLTNSDATEIDIPASVVIPAGQASATFVVTAIDDTLVDGTQTAGITAEASGHDSGTVDIEVSDDEVAALTLVILDDAIGENGGVTTAIVTRTSEASSALVVTLQSSDTSEAAPRQTTITIPAGVSDSAPFFIDAVDDALADGTNTATITATATAHVDGTDSLDVTDDEGAAAVTIVVDAAAISENAGTTTATVSRNTVPDGDLVVTLASSDIGEATVPATVTIPDGQASITFDIDGVDDSVADGSQTITVTGTAAGFVDGTDTLDIDDDEGTAGLSITIADTTISENGGTTTATVTRNTDPTAELTVTLSGDDATEATIPASVVIPAGQTSVTFAITAVDDTAADGNQNFIVTAVANGLANGTGSVEITDDETAALTLSITDSSISETGTTMATVSRNSDTTDALTVNITSLDTGEATVPAAVTIPAGATESAPFAITGVDDTIADGDQTVTIEATATGHVDGTGSIDVTDVSGSAALTISIVADEFSETAGAAATTATVSRNTDTTDELVVTLTSGDTSEATVPATVTIAAGQSTSDPFDIAAIDDTDADGTQTVEITGTAADHANGTDSVLVTDDEVSLAFSVLSPVGTTTDLRPEISWEAVDGAESYDVWINLDNNGGNVFRQLGYTGGTSITPNIDLEFGRYRIFVYANMGGGADQLTADPHTFVVSATPERLTPSGSLDTNTPEFSWNRLAGASSYTIYVNVPGNPLTVTIDDPTPEATTPLTFTPGSELATGDYKWWIRGIRENEWRGSWGAATTFSTGGRSKVTSIAAGSTITTSTPEFTWSTVDNATSYEIYVAQEGTAGPLYRQAGLTGNTFASPILENGNYTVWVRTTLADSTAIWGSGVPFTVNATNTGLQTTPTAPSGPSFETTPQFQWEATTGATSYDIYLHDGKAASLITGLTGTTYTPATALAEGEWTWSIRPVDGSGNGAWSSVVAFNTDGRSTVLTPSGATTDTPTFTWQAANGAFRYVLQVDNLTTGTSNVIREDNLTGTSFTPTTSLEDGDYRVWVRAVSNSSNGKWSLPLDFTVETSVSQLSVDESPTTLLASVGSQLSRVEETAAAAPSTRKAVVQPATERTEQAEQTAQPVEPVDADDLMIAMLSSGEWLEG